MPVKMEIFRGKKCFFLRNSEENSAESDFLRKKYTENWPRKQGCQIVNFQTKNPKLGKLGGSCNGICWYIHIYIGMYVYMDKGLFHCHSTYFVVYWYILWLFGIFPPFGILCQEKSGNLARKDNLVA
jgi:hypothetical protein